MEGSKEHSDFLDLVRALSKAVHDDSNSDKSSDTLENGHVDVVVPYVHELLQLDYQRFSDEGARLEEVKKGLQERKASLVLENYQVLLDVANEIQIISKDLPEIRLKTENLLQNLGSVEESSRLAEKKISDFAEKRQKLLKHQNCISQIKELLDIPQLLESLAKRGLFDEAVELINFTEKLASSSSSSGNPAIESVVEQSKQRGWMIMNLLANQLRAAPVQLLQALKIVSLQRRLGQALGSASESQIRVDFLQARSAFINSQILVISQRDHFHFITKIIEICRLHYFDTMNYYLSVFPDSSDLSSDLHSLPYIWIQTELKSLSGLLLQLLPNIEETRLESILKQLLSLADSLSRFGTSSSSVFLRIFSQHVLKQFRHGLDISITEFRKAVLASNLKRIRNVKPEMVEAKEMSALTIKAPEELIAYPAIALLCNDLLGALSRIRLCFIGNLTVPISLAMKDFVKETSNIVNHCPDSRQPEVADFQDVFFRVFVPFVEKVRDLLCPSTEAALFLGISPGTFKEITDGFISVNGDLSRVGVNGSHTEVRDDVGGSVVSVSG